MTACRIRDRPPPSRLPTLRPSQRSRPDRSASRPCAKRRKPRQSRKRNSPTSSLGADHWTDLGLGDRWREAGEALGPYPEGARRAYAWSVYFYERYHRSWSAHLPASRWDSDGGGEMMEVHELAQALVANPSEAPLPIGSKPCWRATGSARFPPSERPPHRPNSSLCSSSSRKPAAGRAGGTLPATARRHQRGAVILGARRDSRFGIGCYYRWRQSSIGTRITIHESGH